MENNKLSYSEKAADEISHLFNFDFDDRMLLDLAAIIEKHSEVALDVVRQELFHSENMVDSFHQSVREENEELRNTLDEALGKSSVGVDAFQYPQTTFKPSSAAQLRSDEAARVNAILSDKLSTIADIASKLTRKNFSVADIKLVKDLLESVEEYEENK